MTIVDQNQTKKHILLSDLEVYKLSRELSALGWQIYCKMSWQDKKVIGDQFITSVDSVGANITEGYARYHFLDRIKFYYNARGSLSECNNYWIELLLEREKTTKAIYDKFKNIACNCGRKLNLFISSNYNTRQNLSS